MKRVDRLRRESNKNNEDNTRAITDTKSTKPIINNNDNNIPTESESKSDNLQLQHQIAEEKAAARIFPLNLISNRFKSKDPNALKGKLK